MLAASSLIPLERQTVRNVREHEVVAGPVSTHESMNVYRGATLGRERARVAHGKHARQIANAGGLNQRQ